MAEMSYNPNRLYNKYLESIRSGLDIHGRSINIYPKDCGPENNFFDGVQMEAVLESAFHPVEGSEIYIIFNPGNYGGFSFSPTNQYINIRVLDETSTTGLTTAGDGYTISGNTLTVTADAIGTGKKWADEDAVFNYWSVNHGQGTLSATNPAIIVFEKGVFSGNITNDVKYCYTKFADTATYTGTIAYGTVWYGSTIGDGSGDSKANAINIDSAEAFQAIRTDTDNYDLYYVVTKDVDFLGVELKPIAGAVSGNWTGTFDGDGHTFSNAVVATSPDTNNRNGLFRNNHGTIKNIVLDNFSIVGTTPNNDRSYCAILVGENAFGAEILRCTVDGNVIHTHTNSGSTYCIVGMIAGANHGSVQECSASGRVAVTFTGDSTGYCSIGGLIGYQTGGTGAGEKGQCLNSLATTTIVVDGKVGTQLNVGGVVGWVITGTNINEVIDCHYSGNIYLHNTADNVRNRAGGIFGTNSGLVQKCTAKGTAIVISESVTANGGRTRFGGIGGYNSESNTIRCNSDMICYAKNNGDIITVAGGVAYIYDGYVTDCYCEGQFKELDDGSTILSYVPGGFSAGDSSAGAITNCYSKMSAWTLDSGTLYGFTSGTAGTYTDCYWDSTVSGITTGSSAGAYDAKTTSEMLTVATFASWNATDINWRIVAGDYPTLL